MAFHGRSFIYNGVPSEIYGLYIMDVDANGINESMASSSMDITEQKVYRNPTPYLYGMTPAPKLEFEFSAYAEDEITADTFELIAKWLFSSRTYQPLQIDQWDVQDVVFYAIFQDPKIKRVGNIIQGFSATVTCNSPFAFKFPITTTKTYTDSDVNDTFTFYNASDDEGDYLYPTSMIVTMNNIAGDFMITNQSDSNRVVSFTGLSASEILTISPKLQTISSSTGLKRLQNSNYKFLRLVSGENILNIQGNVASFVMTNQYIARKISG